MLVYIKNIISVSKGIIVSSKVISEDEVPTSLMIQKAVLEDLGNRDEYVVYRQDDTITNVRKILGYAHSN